MGDRKDKVLDRNTVFHALFNGKKIKHNKMFSSIKFYSPSCYPRRQSHLSANVEKYNDAVRKRI